MANSLVQLTDEITTGIKTIAVLDQNPRGFMIRWIDWDSSFRSGGLQLGDLITGIDGFGFDDMLTSQKFSNGIGQYGEVSFWKEKGGRDGQTVRLQMIRDGQELDISGQILAKRIYFDNTGRVSMGPGGPDKFARPPFSEWNWVSWYEKYLEKMILVSNFAWVQHYETRRELQENLSEKERIQYLVQNYPGPFADAVYYDWNQLAKHLLGKLIDITAADLEYREIGEKRVQIAKKEAAQAWYAFLEQRSADLIKPFPAAPAHDREKVSGKIVELPRISYRDIINGLGRSFAAIGSTDSGYYFIDLESKYLNPYYAALYRYKNMVNPRVKEQYRCIGQIQNTSHMLVVRGIAVTGLIVRPLCILYGEDECFIDLTAAQTQFAGESVLSFKDLVEVKPESVPEDVIKAMITAVKLGDYSSWKKLFADWQILLGIEGFQVINRYYRIPEATSQSNWEFSRRLILGEVYDTRISRIAPVRRIIRRDPEKDWPDVDEINVFVDHFGLFDGEYRSFNSTKVNRVWSLQRLDLGPWKITSVQHL
jgi:hypothetical protein